MWSDKVFNEEVFKHRIGDKRKHFYTIYSIILHRKISWVGYFLKINCLHGTTEGQMTGVKGVGTIRTKLLDDLRNRRRY